jgi:hypothetical protein
LIILENVWLLIYLATNTEYERYSVMILWFYKEINIKMFLLFILISLEDHLLKSRGGDLYWVFLQIGE